LSIHVARSLVKIVRLLIILIGLVCSTACTTDTVSKRPPSQAPYAMTTSTKAEFTVSVYAQGIPGTKWTDRTAKTVSISLAKHGINKTSAAVTLTAAGLKWTLSEPAPGEAVLRFYEFREGASQQNARREVLTKHYRYNRTTDKFDELSSRS